MPRQATVGLGLGVTLLAAVLGLVDLGDQQLRVDEATSWYIAQLDWSGLWNAVSTSEANSGIYFALLHVWLAFGESEVAIRTLSVVFGVGTVPLIYALGVRLFGTVPAAVGSLLLVVNAFFVEGIQDARGYTMATFFITAASLLFLDVLWKPTSRKVVAYVALGTLAVYAHFFSAFVLAAHALSALLGGPRPLPIGRLASAYVSIAGLITPLVVFTVTNDVGQIDWIGELTWARLGDGLIDLTGDAGPVLAIAYGVGLLLALGTVFVDSGERRSFERWRHVFVLLWAVGPVVAAVLVSFVKPIFQARYLMGTLPALVLAAASGYLVLRGRLKLVGAAAMLVVLLLSIDGLRTWYADPGNPWMQRVDYLVEESDPSDGMVVYSPTMLRPYLYYAHRMDVVDELPDLVYPASLTWPGFSRTRYDPDYETVSDRAREHTRVWLLSGVTWDEPRQEEFRRLRATLSDVCSSVERKFSDPTVFLYDTCKQVLP